MYVKQLYTNCLAHAAYYIESDKEAVVIDPLRNPEPYLELAKERGAKIKYILETHFHADFVSGHIDLANATGAAIVFGPNAMPEYKAYIASDHEVLRVGNSEIEVLHTPGHTIESTCFLFSDKNSDSRYLFTGDTLFVGDVGRPDLLSGNLPKETLAAMMYDFLQSQIKTLPDETIVYPGHGAGSACGKNIGSSSFSTIGGERSTNYALLIEDKDQFIKAVTADLPIAPGYFFKDAVLNKKGTELYHSVLKMSLTPLSLSKFNSLRRPGTVVLDTRDPLAFAAGFIEGALNIGLNGDFAVWAGLFISPEAPILLIVDPGKEKEAIERLARIGFDNVLGYLNGGMDTWFTQKYKYEHILTVSGADMSKLAINFNYDLLDVRNRLEVSRDHISGSTHIPLNELKGRIAGLDKNNSWLIYCAGGYRSMIAASFLLANGFRFVAAWKAVSMPSGKRSRKSLKQLKKRTRHDANSAND